MPVINKAKGIEVETNPNGANQYSLDPRQILCWSFYINPKSETFGNAKQSAIKAGYEEVYANTITVTEWFAGKVRRLNMLNKAERNLDEFLDMDTGITKVTDDGKVYKLDDPQLKGLKLKASTFIAERLGKDHGYSARNELTGKDGGKIEIESTKAQEISTALDDL